jgi:type IV pilus assembly protein PilN
MIRINLLPVRVSKKKTAGKQQLLLFALLIVGGFVVNFVWVQSRTEVLKSAQARIAKTRGEIAQLDRIIGEVKNIKDQQAALREKLDILAELKANRAGPVRVLDALATLTPKRLWLTKLDEKQSVLTFGGQAVTIDDVSAFMTALKGDPHFSAIELQRTTAKAEKALDTVEFTLTAAVAYAPKKPPAPGDPAAKPR